MRRMVPIVAGYLAQGWNVTVAARHVPHAKEALSSFHSTDDRVSVVQAPIFLHHAPAAGKALVSLADIFAHIGFADPALCRPVVRAWRRLLQRTAPHVVLSDFAPSLNVAVAGDCPVIAIGNGWTIPPQGDLPTFLGKWNDSGTREACGRIVDALRAASDGKWLPSSFTQLLRGDETFLCTFPQLDPYRQNRDKEHYWPIEMPAPQGHRTVRDMGVLYLPSDHPMLSPVQAVAERLPWPIHAYAGSADHASQGRLHFSKQPLDLPGVLPSARVALHHGGLGMANWCLIHRVPQMIFPTDIEKSLIGRGLESAKAGVVCNLSLTAEGLVKTIERLADSSLPPPDTSGMRTQSDVQTLSALLAVSSGPD